MRAAGYYPSQAEVAAILSHVTFLGGSSGSSEQLKAANAVGVAHTAAKSGSGLGGKGVTHRGSQGGAGTEEDTVDFDTFLQLYINHRPVEPVTQSDIANAFQALGAATAAGESTHCVLSHGHMPNYCTCNGGCRMPEHGRCDEQSLGGSLRHVLIRRDHCWCCLDNMLHKSQLSHDMCCGIVSVCNLFTHTEMLVSMSIVHPLATDKNA